MSRNDLRRCLVLCVLSSALLCADASVAKNKPGLFLRIRGAVISQLEKHVSSREMSPVEIESCSKLQLGKRSVLDFFAHAEIISAEEMVSSYEALPCGYKGALSVGDASYRFEVNAGGTGMLWVDSSMPIHFGCGARCKDILDVGLY